MDILNRILKLLAEQKRQQIELTNFLGLDKSTFSAWKNGKSTSYKKYLPEIAKFFSITIDELVGNDTLSENNSQFQLEDIYFSFAKSAQEEGIDPEDIELAIKTIKELKRKNKGV